MIAAASVLLVAGVTSLLWTVPVHAANPSAPHAPAAQSSNSQAGTTQTGTVQQYQHDVLPVLQSNCLRCHGGMNHRGGYNMGTRAAAIAGGNHGVAIVPGKPDDSLLIKLIGPGPYPDGIKPMPLNGKLTDGEIATLRQWVASGAVMDQ